MTREDRRIVTLRVGYVDIPITDRDRARFEEFVYCDPLTGCHLWSGHIARMGYGRFGIGLKRKGTMKNALSHRVAWALYRGPVPSGMCVLHKCDNGSCVNPDHLQLGTQEENNIDMARKWRGTSGSGKRLFGARRNSQSEKFSAEVYSRGESFYLGTFDTELEAHLTAVAAKHELMAQKGGDDA